MPPLGHFLAVSGSSRRYTIELDVWEFDNLDDLWLDERSIDAAARFVYALLVTGRIFSYSFEYAHRGYGFLCGFTTKDEAMTAAALLGECLHGSAAGTTHALYALAGWRYPVSLDYSPNLGDLPNPEGWPVQQRTR